MLSNIPAPPHPYQRPQARVLANRLREPRRFLQVVAGPRQVGKTTLVRQVVSGWNGPVVFASADEPALQGRGWVQQQWDRARVESGRAEGLLVLDEVQKAPDWSESVKRLWDEDTRHGTPLRVVLLGSAPLLIQKGLTESLAGRFEILFLPHWSFTEMRDAFGFSLEEFLFFGGYPGAAPLHADVTRWSRYVRDAIIEPTLGRDVLLLTRVDKPALLRRLFELGCLYSGRILSFTKQLGQLQDAGNTTTLAHYLDLLDAAWMLTGLQKYAGDQARIRRSSPKFQIYNTALFTAQAGLTPDELHTDPDFRGRLVESAVGAHLANAAAAGLGRLHYWRQGDLEVDFVFRRGARVTAVEVKSGRATDSGRGMDAFASAYNPHRRLVVGTGGMALETFLSTPVEDLVA